MEHINTLAIKRDPAENGILQKTGLPSERSVTRQSSFRGSRWRRRARPRPRPALVAAALSPRGYRDYAPFYSVLTIRSVATERPSPRTGTAASVICAGNGAGGLLFLTERSRLYRYRNGS
ncbi:hypothetical protein EVAR_65847_1 [Eumeta japonica]|uniref:Uncharacterized protein n=1 Tax=Eumeta variegata TaxID=151549 RepID=A0A4C2A6G1_EUMVA|nr:hypothetical protein EVAR_65847_1 [Eumeta japonica]